MLTVLLKVVNCSECIYSSLLFTTLSPPPRTLPTLQHVEDLLCVPSQEAGGWDRSHLHLWENQTADQRARRNFVRFVVCHLLTSLSLSLLFALPGHLKLHS